MRSRDAAVPAAFPVPDLLGTQQPNGTPARDRPNLVPSFSEPMWTALPAVPMRQPPFWLGSPIPSASGQFRARGTVQLPCWLAATASSSHASAHNVLDEDRYVALDRGVVELVRGIAHPSGDRGGALGAVRAFVSS